MFRCARALAAFALTLFLFLSGLQAQETVTAASVTGRVLDPSGAAVPHAPVSALQSATNETYTTQADAQGRFRLPYLPAGLYRISAQANGFQEAVTQVQLSIGAAFDLTLRLALSQATSSVQVSAISSSKGREILRIAPKSATTVPAIALTAW